MEIELTTTKKKLTKSIINQMKKASIQAVISGESIGYVINIVKDSSKTLIIKYMAQYFTFPCGYEKGNGGIYRKIGKWTNTIKIDDEVLLERFIDEYNLKISFSGQIYI